MTTDLTEKERAVIGRLLRNLERTDAAGRAIVHFGVATVGKLLLRKMLTAGWVWQSGWFLLSRKGCYQLTDEGIRELSPAGKEIK